MHCLPPRLARLIAQSRWTAVRRRVRACGWKPVVMEEHVVSLYDVVRRIVHVFLRTYHGFQSGTLRSLSSRGSKVSRLLVWLVRKGSLSCRGEGGRIVGD